MPSLNEFKGIWIIDEIDQSNIGLSVSPNNSVFLIYAEAGNNFKLQALANTMWNDDGTNATETLDLTSTGTGTNPQLTTENFTIDNGATAYQASFNAQPIAQGGQNGQNKFSRITVTIAEVGDGDGGVGGGGTARGGRG